MFLQITANVSIHARLRDNLRKTQMTKKINIHFADSSLEFLSLLISQSDDVGISTATNLAIQTCALLLQQKINLTANELLYCCDVLNPGVNLTQRTPPDQANIIAALKSMAFGLRDSVNDHAALKKWDIDKTIRDKINAMTMPELIALAFTTRLFWSREKYYGCKPHAACLDYTDWANQFIIGTDEGVGDERT
jgi:hypothetical protein